MQLVPRPPMLCQPRLDAPGVLQHVMVRGIERTQIFRADADRAALNWIVPNFFRRVLWRASRILTIA
jgi:hypothetical protein